MISQSKFSNVCSECNGAITAINRKTGRVSLKNNKVTCGDECAKKRDNRKKAIRAARRKILKLKCESGVTEVKKSLSDIQDEKKIRVMQQFKTTLPIGSRSKVDGFLYKVGKHNLFYRKNVDNSDWTRAEPDIFGFCSGLIT